MLIGNWVCCPYGRGYLHEDIKIGHERVNPDTMSVRLRHFKERSIGVVQEINQDTAKIWLIGINQTWQVKLSEIHEIDVTDTGDKRSHKICNICHCLLPVEKFAINQRNKHGIIRRPSCKLCRTDIDKRAPKSSQAKIMEKRKPRVGSAFKCPICQKRSIVGVTAKIVADHNHHTGDIRDFICDSCNTGLGRFKNGKDCLRDALRYIEERECL